MTATAADRTAARANPALPAISHVLDASDGVHYFFQALIAAVTNVATKATRVPGPQIRGWCVNRDFVADTDDESLSRVEVRAGQLDLKISGTDPVTAADHLRIVYAEDDQTIARTSAGGTLSPVGRLLR